MKFHTLSLGQIRTNCYIAAKDNQAIIFDPGAEPDRLIAYLKQHELDLAAILLTHGHFDHIGAVDELRSHYKIPVYIHPAEKNWLMTPSLNSSSAFPLGEIKIQPADNMLELGQTEIAGIKFNVIHTPGHSPGGVSFIFEEQATVISGDCLFQGGIGRTDLVGGDQATLIDSIQALYSLPEAFKVLSGHGPATSIGYEKKHNPFVRGI